MVIIERRRYYMFFDKVYLKGSYMKNEGNQRIKGYFKFKIDIELREIEK